jgi:spore coat protein U-like protein
LLKTILNHEGSSSPYSVWFVVSVSVLVLLLSTGTCTSSEDCRIIFVSGITFPRYDPLLPGPVTGNGSFIVKCLVSAHGEVSLSAGSSGDFGQRSMKGDGGDILLYNLYGDTSRTTPWGDGKQDTYAASFAFGEGGGSKQFFVYGSIPEKQNVGSQSFAEELTITVDW